jgi:hypothetical protein
MNKHIVICGFPRSGSTLLLQMLIHSVKNYDIPDREFRAANYLCENDNCITKRPGDIFEIDNILNNKSVEIIITTRDVRNIITSFLLSPVKSDPTDVYFIGYDSVSRPHPKADNCGIKHYYEAINYVKSKYDIYEIKYEELVTNPEKIQKDMQVRFGFEYKGKFADFYKRENINEATDLMLNGLRPLDPTRLYGWKKHKGRIVEQFTKFPELFDILIEQGYEQDEKWVDNFIEGAT